jgi:hypothetical protein
LQGFTGSIFTVRGDKMSRLKIVLLGIAFVAMIGCAATTAGQKPSSSGSAVVDAVQDTGRSIWDGVQSFFGNIFK